MLAPAPSIRDYEAFRNILRDDTLKIEEMKVPEDLPHVFIRFDKFCTLTAFRILTFIRSVFLLTAVILLFILQGKEIEYGFWTITIFVYFVIKEIYVLKTILIEII